MARLSCTVLVAALAGCGGTSPPPGAPTEVASAPAPADPAAGAAQAAVPELPAFPAEPFRAERPSPAPERPFHAPPVKRFQLPQGVDAYLIEDHDLPVVELGLDLEGGTMNDPKAKAGLASICTAMLTEGTTRLDKVAYSEALADIASTISSYAGEDRQGITMRTLKRNLPATFALYAETITAPGFRQVDFDRMVKRSLEALKQAKASPGPLGARLGDVVLYGVDHPLGRIPTEASLGAITLDDCKRYHADTLRPKAARLFVVGDVTEAEVRAAFKPLLAGWKGAPRRSVAVPRPRTEPARVHFVHVAGAAQSSISMVHLGPARTARTYFANHLMAQLLGGGFASRINMNLREAKGYSYGARGGFGYNRFFGSFNAASSVRTDATAQSLIELVGEVRSIKDGTRPPAEAELQREQNAVILGLPSLFATAQETLDSYRNLVYFGLPASYYQTYAANMKAVTTKTAARAAARELKPAQARFLVVGDGDAPQIAHDPQKGPVPMLGPDGKQLTLRQALASLTASGKLGRGAVIELDADGKPVAASAGR